MGVWEIYNKDAVLITKVFNTGDPTPTLKVLTNIWPGWELRVDKHKNPPYPIYVKDEFVGFALVMGV